MSQPVICRTCHKPFRDFPTLKDHNQIEHPEYAQKVSRWLGDETETKLKVLEAQLKEGRPISYKESNDD